MKSNSVTKALVRWEKTTVWSPASKFFFYILCFFFVAVVTLRKNNRRSKQGSRFRPLIKAKTPKWSNQFLYLVCTYYCIINDISMHSKKRTFIDANQLFWRCNCSQGRFGDCSINLVSSTDLRVSLFLTKCKTCSENSSFEGTGDGHQRNQKEKK